MGKLSQPSLKAFSVAAAGVWPIGLPVSPAAQHATTHAIICIEYDSSVCVGRSLNAAAAAVSSDASQHRIQVTFPPPQPNHLSADYP